MLDGTTLAVTFDRAVAADSDVTITFAAQDTGRTVVGFDSTCLDFDSQIVIPTYDNSFSASIAPIPFYQHMISLFDFSFAYHKQEVLGASKYSYLATPSKKSSGFVYTTGTTYKNAVNMLAYGRAARTHEEIANGVSFAQSIPAPENGLVFRLALYGCEARLDTCHVNRFCDVYGRTRVIAPSERARFCVSAWRRC